MDSLSSKDVSVDTLLSEYEDLKVLIKAAEPYKDMDLLKRMNDHLCVLNNEIKQLQSRCRRASVGWQFC